MTDEDPREGRIRLGRRRDKATESLDETLELMRRPGPHFMVMPQDALDELRPRSPKPLHVVRERREASSCARHDARAVEIPDLADHLSSMMGRPLGWRFTLRFNARARAYLPQQPQAT